MKSFLRILAIVAVLMAGLIMPESLGKTLLILSGVFACISGSILLYIVWREKKDGKDSSNTDHGRTDCGPKQT
jgi:hypothetical protein